ncbi:MAG: MOSC domain-containing protein [Bacillaceae bacterium]|nr:MOSC domain-containing protein [Bacillaceae bacterium]
MSQAILLSMQTGKTRTIRDGRGKDWTSAIHKQPVDGPLWLSRNGLEGDQQADLKHHGGVDKAILAYGASRYAFWQKEWNRTDLFFGGFGENFTVDGLDEEGVCIGDVYQVGNTVVQVSQPRQPCWKLARRWSTPDLVQKILRLGYSGWYMRVIEEGYVQKGDSFTRIEQPFPEWTIIRCHQLMNKPEADTEQAVELASCPVLARAWRDTLKARVERLR